MRQLTFTLVLMALAIGFGPQAIGAELLHPAVIVPPDFTECPHPPKLPLKVQVVVAADGSVLRARVVKSMAPCAAMAVARAVKQSRFEPLLMKEAAEIHAIIDVPLRKTERPATHLVSR
jgi:hypothetical protein